MILVLGCPCVVRGDAFRVLADDRQSIQARIDLIQQAQHDVVVAYYAVDTGRVPVALLTVLREAAQRGVRVRMIVDGLKARFPAHLYDYLETQGVEVRSYHPLRAGHPLWLNRRLHVKLLVADGQQMIVGSRNMQDEHFGLDEVNFVDCDAYVCGDSAAHARRYFDWLWQSDDVRPIRTLDSPTYGIVRLHPTGGDAWSKAWRKARGPQDFQRLMDQSLAELVRCRGIHLYSQTDWSAGFPCDVPVVLVHDNDVSKHTRNVEQAVLGMIANAGRSVLIETPYPVLTDAVEQAILCAQGRGVRVTFLTNSLTSTDNIPTYAAYQNRKRVLLEAGVEIWEFNGPDTLHAKAMVIDDCVAVIGSYNFDPRSAHLNLELIAAAYGRQPAADLQQAILRHLDNAHRVTAAPPPWPFALLPPPLASDPATSGAPAARRVKMQLQRWAVPGFRWLL